MSLPSSYSKISDQYPILEDKISNLGFRACTITALYIYEEYHHILYYPDMFNVTIIL